MQSGPRPQRLEAPRSPPGTESVRAAGTVAPPHRALWRTTNHNEPWRAGMHLMHRIVARRAWRPVLRTGLWRDGPGDPSYVPDCGATGLETRPTYRIVARRAWRPVLRTGLWRDGPGDPSYVPDCGATGLETRPTYRIVARRAWRPVLRTGLWRDGPGDPSYVPDCGATGLETRPTYRIVARRAWRPVLRTGLWRDGQECPSYGVVFAIVRGVGWWALGSSTWSFSVARPRIAQQAEAIQNRTTIRLSGHPRS